MFADTSGWATVADRRQSFHAQAARLVQAAVASGESIVTSNFVLVELTALFTRPLRIPRLQQIQFLDDLSRQNCGERPSQPSLSSSPRLCFQVRNSAGMKSWPAKKRLPGSAGGNCVEPLVTEQDFLSLAGRLGRPCGLVALGKLCLDL